ncbi:hypothetical protein V8E54_010490 [Elaphomyces granulatus]
MSPLQDSPELPPTRASVRGRGTGRKQKKIPDKTVDASLIEPADSGQALNHEHIQTRNKKKEYGKVMCVHVKQRGDEPADYPDLNVKSSTKGRAGKRRMTPLVSLDDVDNEGRQGSSEALG